MAQKDRFGLPYFAAAGGLASRAVVKYVWPNEQSKKKRARSPNKDYMMRTPYGRSGKFIKRRRSKKRKTSRCTKQTKRVALKAALSLCEPKMLRSTEQFCTIGHNIPHFFTGGLNIGILTNEDLVWAGGFSQPPATAPRWTPLIEDVATVPWSDVPIGNLGSNQMPIGRYSTSTHPVTSAEPDIRFDTSNEAKNLSGRLGSEICPSKLVYKIEFNAAQGFEPAGVSAKYVCYLFRYKTENLSGHPASHLASSNNAAVQTRANELPLTNVGRNTAIQARDFFKGRQGEGQVPWGIDPTGVLPSSLNTGNPVVDTESEIQLAWEGRASNKFFKVVDKKEFSFDMALAYSTANQGQAPQHTNTVFLSHHFKAGDKLKFGQEVRTMADTEDEELAIQGPSLIPRGHNYGVCIVANATKQITDGATTQIGYLKNWQWDHQVGDATPGRLAAYTISKALYYKDP